MNYPSFPIPFRFYKTLTFQLGNFALPILLSNILSSIVQLTDQAMVSYLGEESFVAIGIANNLFFLFMVFLFSFPSGTTILMSRSASQQNHSESSRILLVAIVSSLLFSGTIIILNLLFQDQFLTFILKNWNVDHIAIQYNSWIIWSYPFVGIGGIMIMVLRIFNLAYFVMFLTGFLVILNLGLDYLFIFGLPPFFPAMGVEGAGLATFISRIIYVSLTILCLFTKRKFLFSHFTNFKVLNFKNIHFFLTFCLSMGLADFTFALSIMMVSKIFGLMGLSSIAAFNLISAARGLSIIPFIALGQANVFYISKKIARHLSIDRLFFYGKSLFKINLMVASLESILIFILIPPLFNFFYKIEPASNLLFHQFILIFALFWVFIPSNSFYTLMYRAGGNIQTNLIMNFTFDGGIAIILTFLGYFLKFPPWMTLMLFFGGAFSKFIVYSFLFKKKTWLIHKKTKNQSFSFGESMS